MDIIQELIKEYTLKYERANTKSKKKRIAEELFDISDLYYNYLRQNDLLLWDKEGIIDDFYVNHLNYLLHNIISNNECYHNISKKIIDDFKNSNYNFNKYYYDNFKEWNKISFNDMYAIIKDFLRKIDNNLITDFNSLFDKDQALFLNTLYSETAFIYNLNNIKSSLLIFNSYYYDNYSIEFAAILMHEFGHRTEFNLYNNRSYFNDRRHTPFYEVASSFLEYAFINYLIDNNIYKEDALRYLNRFLRNILYYSVDISVLSNINIDINNIKGSINFDDVNDMRKDIINNLNYYYPRDICGYDFKNAYIYGLGSIISIYLYDYYKNNKNEFFQHYNNALLNYPFTNNINSFNEVGVNEDRIINGDVLIRILKNN